MPKLKLSFPHFQTAGFGGLQMGEARRGQICRAKNEATRKPNIPPSSSERNQRLPSANFGREYATTSWESTLEDNMQLVITFPTLSVSKRNSSSNWMDFLRSQHLEQQEYDEEITKYLNSLGYKVIRFWNNDVINDSNLHQYRC